MAGLVGFPDAAGEKVAMAAPYGTRKYQGKVQPHKKEYINQAVPQFAGAIKKAENNARNHGVLSVKTKDAAGASKVLDNSVYNNYVRWQQAGKPGKFVDFMQKRWAPIGAENDPDNLNKNWAPNVRKFLQKDPNVDYEELQANDMVMNAPMARFA